MATRNRKRIAIGRSATIPISHFHNLFIGHVCNTPILNSRVAGTWRTPLAFRILQYEANIVRRCAQWIRREKLDLLKAVALRAARTKRAIEGAVELKGHSGFER